MVENGEYLSNEDNKIILSEEAFNEAEKYIGNLDDNDFLEGFQELKKDIKSLVNKFNSLKLLAKKDDLGSFINKKIGYLNALIDNYVRTTEVGYDDVIAGLGKISESETRKALRNIIINKPDPLLTSILKSWRLVKTGEKNIDNYSSRERAEIANGPKDS